MVSEGIALNDNIKIHGIWLLKIMNILPKNLHKPSVELVEDVKKSEGSKALIITKS